MAEKWSLHAAATAPRLAPPRRLQQTPPMSLTQRIKSYARQAFNGEQEGLATDVFDQLPQVVFAIDRRGHWCWLSDNWRALTGLSPQQCIGRSCDEQLHPRDREHFHQRLDEAFAARPEQDDCELRLLTESGDFRWLEVRFGAPPAAARGGRAGQLVGTLADITGRVAEEAALLASHRSLSALINDLPGMVYRCRNDHAWTMEYVSAGCEALTGHSPADIVNNRRLSYGGLIHPDDQDAVWIEVQSAIREQRNFDTVYRLCTASGRQKWVWERGRGVFDSGGELLSLEGFITDVTQDKLKTDALIRSNFYDADIATPTEQLFRDRLAMSLARSAARATQRSALLLLQLHGLGELAHHADDCQLAASKRALAACIRPQLGLADSLCSLEADRFAVLTEGELDAAAALALGQRLLDALLQPLQVEGRARYVTASIGIALSESPDERADESAQREGGGDDDAARPPVAGSNGDDGAERLLRRALGAMDRARELGGSRCELAGG